MAVKKKINISTTTASSQECMLDDVQTSSSSRNLLVANLVFMKRHALFFIGGRAAGLVVVKTARAVHYWPRQ